MRSPCLCPGPIRGGMFAPIRAPIRAPIQALMHVRRAPTDRQNATTTATSTAMTVATTTARDVARRVTMAVKARVCFRPRRASNVPCAKLKVEARRASLCGPIDGTALSDRNAPNTRCLEMSPATNRAPSSDPRRLRPQPWAPRRRPARLQRNVSSRRALRQRSVPRCPVATAVPTASATARASAEVPLNVGASASQRNSGRSTGHTFASMRGWASAFG